ncbi:DUF3093 domain-containing protein [Cellulomonas pakistanensis]|uniref:DUF3093 domain-containing protein n=1 Tax=Cellulomonas pakistanensis TaxID=992287 RepID=A0A919PEI6_9CELL|nr:DUF3093 domain-containing protein [Cellulomonas pakistanensis]GIG38060.1 hypothetical protein Cpa01nite_34410 [Cellulomonas pakistanensis]
MQTTTAPAFAERLWPSPAGWLAVPALAAMLGIVLVPLSPVAAAVAAAAGLVAAAAAAVRLSTPVRVEGGELHAGDAHVPVALLRAPRALDAAETRHELGPGLDARAHVCLRGWVRTAVRVELDDPADPTPYWVVSTRRPAELVAALGGDPAAGAGDPGTR